MGRVFRTYLAADYIFCCRECGTHFAVAQSVISSQFNGQHGKAMLMSHAVNTYTGAPEDREMRTGRHTVRDLYCRGCHTIIGWKYDFAHEPDQKYKEGRYILEREMITEVPEGKRETGRPKIEEISVRELMARV